jgi:hypothetical protein
MPEHFENQEATQQKAETVSDATAEKKIDRMAEKAAEKSTETAQRYDRDHGIFSK